MIVYDPREVADATRGSVSDALVESIDLAPTFLDAVGAKVPGHILEGRSLTPFLHGVAPDDWRSYAVSEYDYSPTQAAKNLDVAPRDARMFMVVTDAWKLIHAEGGFRPMLFDMKNDPGELHDLGGSADHGGIIEMMYEHLNEWALRMSQRTTVSDEQIMAMRSGGGSIRKGIVLGVYDQDEIDPALLVKYRGKAQRRIPG
jgi:arylsulfatase A-like enzyme